MKTATPLLTPPDEANYIFTEGIDYMSTGENSIWGEGDPDTLLTLQSMPLRGRWINLAAGDGRYHAQLLEKVDSLTCADIDRSALQKLTNRTPEKYKSKVKSVVCDIGKPLPFQDKEFDGVFCTGTLHLFPEKKLRDILAEFGRIVKPHGKMILDFATDIRRDALRDKSLITFGKEPLYSTKEMKKLLASSLQNCSVSFRESRVNEDCSNAEPPYNLKCTCLLVLAQFT